MYCPRCGKSHPSLDDMGYCGCNRDMPVRMLGRDDELLIGQLTRRDWELCVVALKSATATSLDNGHDSQAETFRLIYQDIEKRLETKGYEPFRLEAD
jgi:hypothetical protein